MKWNDPPKMKAKGRVTSKKSKNPSDKSSTSAPRCTIQRFTTSGDKNSLKLVIVHAYRIYTHVSSNNIWLKT